MRTASGSWHFGEQLGKNDGARTLFFELTRLTVETKHQVCLNGYLSAVREVDPALYQSTLRSYLEVESTAWLGATIVLGSDYDEALFLQCLKALRKRWIDPQLFRALQFGRTIETILSERVRALLDEMRQHESHIALILLIELLDSLSLNNTSSFTSSFVFEAVSRPLSATKTQENLLGYHWKDVCLKLGNWDRSCIAPLLNALLLAMKKHYRLSYHSDVVEVANGLVSADPAGAWEIVETHFEKSLPKRRSDIFTWLKGGLPGFHESVPRGAIVDLPVPEIVNWIEEDPEPRAVLIAHAALGTLDNEQGGRLTRELLSKYGHFDGVKSAISATFHSGGWSGPTSAYLKRKREKLRRWLAADYDIGIVDWVEMELGLLDKKIEREEIDEECSRFA